MDNWPGLHSIPEFHHMETGENDTDYLPKEVIGSVINIARITERSLMTVETEFKVGNDVMIQATIIAL